MAKELPAAVKAVAPSARFLKQVDLANSPGSGDWFPGAGSEIKTTQIVADMLKNIREGGPQKCIDYAVQLDKWPKDKPVLLTKEDIEKITAVLPQKVKDDCHYQHDRVKRFAEQTRNSMKEISYEVSPGCTLGTRLLPMTTAGCYVPGGRYCHISSAIMSVATAKVAGVKHVVACSPPMPGTTDMHPATVYAMHVAGADHILAMGGVQAIAAMAFGYLTDAGPAEILVGPGNAFVAEAKRQLFGRLGIDMFAGPTEIAVIADETADSFMVASDLVSQAEHGLNSPAWLFTTSEELGKKTMEEVEKAMDKLVTCEPANPVKTAWRDFGEVIVVANREEMAAVSDLYAAEHLEVHAKDLDWWLKTLKNYGSLFLGEETCVSYGDKCSGTNHILPTKSVSRYSGGLSVDKFIKKLTWQRMTRESNREVGAACARISRLEGMEGHARAGDDRLAKYFPSETFDLEVQWKRPRTS